MGNHMDLDLYMQMSESPLISRHLTRLELRGLCMCSYNLNFSGCPALEDLEISYCHLGDVEKMASPSLKRLHITSCEFSEGVDYRFRICLPLLVSLRLEDMFYFRTPLLESMPGLVEAYVQIGSFQDACSCDDLMGCYHVMRPGHISDSDDEEGNSDDSAIQATTKCVLLEGLAQAKHLVLTAEYSTFIFRRDLRWCPTFSKLNTLVLNSYLCEPADRTLLCFLEHAPVLEKVTVLFSRKVEHKYKVELKGRPDATNESTTISQHLQIVEVKCGIVDEKVLNILNVLGTFDIYFQIRVTKE